jgi:hypothetical protein
MSGLAGFALIPLLLTELPYYLVMLFVHFVFKATIPFQTYFEQLFGQAVYLILVYLDAPITGVKLVNFLTYPFLLWKLEGPAFSIGLLMTLILLLRARREEDGFAAVLVFFPFVLCTLFNPRSRYLSGFLPFAGLLMAVCLQRLWTHSPGGKTKWRQGAVAAAAVGILVFGSLYAHSALRSKVSYTKAIDFMQAQGVRKHLASHVVVSQVLVGVKNVPSEWPMDDEELRDLYDRGHRYYILDFFKDAVDVVMARFNLAEEGERFVTFQKRLDVMNRIEERTKPVFTCPNRHVDEISNAFEVNQDFPKTMLFFRKLQEEPRARTIRVYDLKDYLEP